MRSKMKVGALATAVLIAVAVPVAIAQADDEPLWHDDCPSAGCELEIVTGFGWFPDAESVDAMNEQAALLSEYLADAGIDHETVTLDVVTWDVTDEGANRAVAEFYEEQGMAFGPIEVLPFFGGGLPFPGDRPIWEGGVIDLLPEGLPEGLEECLEDLEAGERGEVPEACVEFVPFDLEGELPDIEGWFEVEIPPFFDGEPPFLPHIPQQLEVCLDEFGGSGEFDDLPEECRDLIPFDLQWGPFEMFDGDGFPIPGIGPFIDGDLVEVGGEICVFWTGEVPEELIDPGLELPIEVRVTDGGAEVCLRLDEGLHLPHHEIEGGG